MAVAHPHPRDRAPWLQIARAELARLFGDAQPLEIGLETANIPSAPQVNVTLRSRGAVRGSMSGHGATLLEQIRDAVARAASDHRFAGPLVACERDRLFIEVWIKESAIGIPCERRGDAIAMVPGIEGLEVELGAAFAYYKPSVALTRKFRSFGHMLTKLCRKAGLDGDAWRYPWCWVRRTRWSHFSEDRDGNTVELVSLCRIHSPEPDEYVLRGWIEGGAAFLMNSQTATGMYAYEYSAVFDQDRGGGNLVRSAGCTYAMALAASVAASRERQDRWRHSAARSADALLDRAVGFGDGWLIPEPDAPPEGGGKLGTVALLAVALSCPSLRATYPRERQRLLTTIGEAQRADGTFLCRLGGGKERARHVDFYPGQALLALALSSQSGDTWALERCRRAFRPCREHFRRQPNSAFVLWQADAWSRIALIEDNEAMADFVFELIDWLLPFQVGREGPEPYRGGFLTNASAHASCVAASSFVYTEAISRGAKLALQRRDLTRWTRYRTAVLDGLRFCSRLLIGGEHWPFLPHPARALGGVRASMSSFEVRCDNLQHMITCALSVLEMTDFFGVPD
jgi:AMMECR1 domain-containing protein